MAAGRKLPLLLLALLLTVAAAAVPSLAASGGAMGGRVCSSRSKSTRPSSSSYSRPHWEPHHSYHYSTFHVPVGTPPPAPRSGSGEGKAGASAAGEGSWFRWEVLVFGIVLLGVFVCCSYYFAPPPRARMTIVKLQVALVGYAKPFQRELNEIAEKVDSSERRWYKYILTETICSLRRHRDCCVSSSVSVDFKYGGEAWEGHFDIISIEERSRFDAETLYNMEGIERKKAYYRKQSWSRNEYIVVTILVAADGALEFPKITRPADMEAVVRKLLSILEGDIRGIHVLWTPQEENDVLTEEKFLTYYPHLKPCYD